MRNKALQLTAQINFLKEEANNKIAALNKERLDYILASKVKFRDKEYKVKDIQFIQDEWWYDDPYNSYWQNGNKEIIFEYPDLKRPSSRTYISDSSYEKDKFDKFLAEFKDKFGVDFESIVKIKVRRKE